MVVACATALIVLSTSTHVAASESSEAARLSALASIDRGASREVVRLLHDVELAVPSVIAAVAAPADSDGRVILLVYRISRREACFVSMGPVSPSERAEVNEICNAERGTDRFVTAVRCAPGSQGGSSCASARLIWSASLRNRSALAFSAVRLQRQNIDADPELETVVDWVREESTTDGDVSDIAYHETLVVDADGAVIARGLLSYSQDIARVGGFFFETHVRETGVTFDVARCDLRVSGCTPEMTRLARLVREPIRTPESTGAASFSAR